jgi:hypothetical protein
VALSHHAQQARIYWKIAQRKLLATEKAYSQECKLRVQAQADVEELRLRNENLEKSDAELKKWELRKPQIYHYMDQVGQMARYIR